MTNKPNDARVSRELLERALACATSTNTSNWSSRLCEDLRLALAQPADQQGEPICYQARHSTSEPWFFTDKPGYWEWRAIYAQPATAKVDENAEFEIWRNDQIESLERMGYQDAAKAFRNLGSVHWTGWQARAKLNGGQS